MNRGDSVNGVAHHAGSLRWWPILAWMVVMAMMMEMGIWLLVLETVLIGLLGAALGLAVLGRWGRGWVYMLGVLWLLPPVAAGVTLACFAGSLRFGHDAVGSYFTESAFLAVALTVGSGWLFLRGRSLREGRFRAAAWPRLRLLVAWLLASALQLLTIYVLDGQVKAYAATERERTAVAFAALTGPMPMESDNAWPLYERALMEMTAICRTMDRELRAKAESERQRVAEASTRPAKDADIPTPGALLWTSAGAMTAEDLLWKANAERPETAELLKRLDPVIALIRQASQRPANRMPAKDGLPTFFDGASESPHAGMRKAAMLLQAHALVMARQGRFEIAVQDVQTLHRMASHVDQSRPSLLAGLVRDGVNACGDDALVESLPYARSPLELPADIVTDEFQSREAFDRNLRGEEEVIVATLLGLANGTLDMHGYQAFSPRVGMAYGILWLERDVPRLRELMASERERLSGRPVRTDLYGRGGVPRGSTVLQILSPSLKRAVTARRGFDTWARQARIVIALTQYRLEHGDYPASLDVLVPRWLPAIPADPYDQQPMRYRLDGRHAIIYSVGENMRDDGGMVAFEKGRYRGDDGYRLGVTGDK